MSVVGSVQTIPLTDFLQLLAASRRSGRLQVVQNHRATKIYFEHGRIVACSADDPPKLLGQFLLYSGAITEDVLRAAMAEQVSSSAGLPAILVAMGAVAADDLEQAVAAKSQETLLALFDLNEATYRFEEQGTPGATDVKMSLDVADLILRSVKREDDRKRVRSLLPPAAVPRPTDKPAPAGGWTNRSTTRVYEAVDGRRSVEEITIQVHGIDFLVVECLLQLIDSGHVEVGKAEAGKTAAGEAAAGEARARPSERPAARAEAGGESRRRRTPSALERARGCLDAGDPDDALAILGEAHRDDPTDNAVTKLLAEAETALAEQIRRQGFAPETVPVPIRSRGGAGEDDRASAPTPAERFILDLADGSMDIQSMIWIAPMRMIEVLRALRSLVKSGWIELR